MDTVLDLYTLFLAVKENIHWIFNYGLVLLIYPVYLFINWFLLTRARGIRVEG